MIQKKDLTILLPCLNESRSLAYCISEIEKIVKEAGISNEILIADNGSVDNSREIAQSLGARVIVVGTKGYGAAVRAGINSARGEIILLADADGSYDFSEIPSFVNEIKVSNVDLVIGNRFKGGIEKGAMPWLHRYFGNPLLSSIGRLLYGISIGDFHCGIRAFKKTSVERLNLSTTGMEFASELIIKAHISRMKVTEIPSRLKQDLRQDKSHLRTWIDGWAHLSLMILLGPRWIFLFPGIFLTSLGILGTGILLLGPLSLFGYTLEYQALIFSSSAIFIGFFNLHMRSIGEIYKSRLGVESRLSISQISLVHKTRGWMLLFYLFGIGLSTSLTIYSLWIWKSESFGELDVGFSIRLATMINLIISLSIQGISFHILSKLFLANQASIIPESYEWK